jgi:uroporphyrinogen-III synthase
MRVLVTRPEPDGERTAEALRKRGHEPLLARLTAIIPANPPLAAGTFEAAVATSAHALECLPPGWQRRIGPDLPVYVVGERTAEAARKAGFRSIIAGPGDAAGLTGLLLRDLKPRSHILYLAGEPRKPALEARLAEANHAVHILLVYRAEPVAVPPPQLLLALDGQDIAILHFSRASASSFRALAAKAGRTAEAAGALHVCLSADVALGLDGLSSDHVRIAAAPQESSLLDALDAALAQNMPWPAFRDDGSVPPR